MAKNTQLNGEIIKQIREAYVQKGYAPLAISALVGVEVGEVQAYIKEASLEAARALFLAENPNVSARVAAQAQLGSILDKQQKGLDLSSSELSFLTKLQEQQREDAEENADDFHRLSGEELDKKIKTMWAKVYHQRKNTYAPRPNRRGTKAE